MKNRVRAMGLERARALARAGQALVRERYTIEGMMARTTRIYDELLRQ